MGLYLRYGGDQRHGVWMLRLGEDAVYRPNLNDRAEVHNCNAVGEVAHHIKVVADEHVGEAVLLAEVCK